MSLDILLTNELDKLQLSLGRVFSYRCFGFLAWDLSCIFVKITHPGILERVSEAEGAQKNENQSRALNRRFSGIWDQHPRSYS